MVIVAFFLFLVVLELPREEQCELIENRLKAIRKMKTFLLGAQIFNSAFFFSFFILHFTSKIVQRKSCIFYSRHVAPNMNANFFVLHYVNHAKKKKRMTALRAHQDSA